MRMLPVVLVALLLMSNGAWAVFYLSAGAAADDRERQVRFQAETTDLLTRLVLEAPREGAPEEVVERLQTILPDQVVKLGPNEQVEVGAISLTYRDRRLAAVEAW